MYLVKAKWTFDLVTVTANIWRAQTFYMVLLEKEQAGQRGPAAVLVFQLKPYGANIRC